MDGILKRILSTRCYECGLVAVLTSGTLWFTHYGTESSLNAVHYST
jgi:hypothetical protein